MFDSSDTIFALSSGALPAGVAVVRISGRHCSAVAQALSIRLPEPRQAKLRSVHDQAGRLLDHGLVLWFPGPHSFTGEDCLELHLHGGRAVVREVLGAIGSVTGLRPADAGEFSRRAFISGKLDLTEVEALADLIAADTSAQLSLALAGANGLLRRKAEAWRNEVVGLRALVEADLDFADEGDIPDSVAEQVWRRAASLAEEIAAILNDGHRGEIVREGFRVVLMGKPNAGKSSLLNALAGRDIAIVSPEAGTTRDVIETQIELDGQKIVLMDTAGIRETSGLVEQEGIRRALGSAKGANLVVWLTEDGSGPVVGAIPQGINWVVLRTKDDDGSQGSDGVSVVSAGGLDGLLALLRARLPLSSAGAESAVITRERHRSLLELAVRELLAAAEAVGVPIEIRAEHIRIAGDAIGRITGLIGAEEVLGRIFSEFCVGK